MKILTLLYILILPLSLYSQNDSALTFGLPELKIKQREKGKTVDYFFENSLNKFILTPGVLYPDTNRYNYNVKLSDIRRVSFRNGSAFWDVAGMGGAAGFVLGFLVVGAVGIMWDENHHFNFGAGFAGGIILAVPMALIGGFMGAISPNYDAYDVYNLSDSQKYNKLKQLFKKYRVHR